MGIPFNIFLIRFGKSLSSDSAQRVALDEFNLCILFKTILAYKSLEE